MKRKRRIANYYFWIYIALSAIIYLFGCASFSPTKPNLPYAGNPYPPVLEEVAQKNPLFVEELGKLPEIQDGLSETEMSALSKIVELYKSDPSNFLNVFNEMYQVGLPEFRKYCSPLQALYWLVKDGMLDSKRDFIINYSLKKLLNKAWNTNPLSSRILSDQQINEIIEGIEDANIKNLYLDDVRNGLTHSQIQNSFAAEYKRSMRMNSRIFSKNAAQIINQTLLKPKELPRWKNTDEVIDRLNAPELLDFYINNTIRYAHYIPGFIRPTRDVLKEKYGDCDELANLGRVALSRAGYNCFGRLLGPKYAYPNHIGLGIELEDGTYILAVHFDQAGNHMSGPYKTLLELDTALGFGTFFSTRGPWNFSY